MTQEAAVDSTQMQGLIDIHMTAENHGDIDGAVAVYTEDVEHDVVGFPDSPSRGKDAARDFYAYLTANFRSESWDVGGSRSAELTRTVVAVPFPARRQQPRELVALGRASFGHRLIDVAFDGSNRQRQPCRDIPIGQPLPDQHHDFSFAVGQRQSFDRLAQSWRTGAATLLGQRFGPCRASQRRPA